MRSKNLFWLFIIGVYLFFLMNSSICITDPVESNYALTAKEMVLSNDYFSPQIYGQYWYDKPVFFYWLLASAFKIGGFTEFAARFWPAVFSLLGLFLTYYLGKKLYSERTGLYSALILGTCFAYWYIGKAVITDMVLFVFFNSILVFFYLAYSGEQKNYYYLAYFFADLATLTKGPIGFLLPGLIILLFLFWTKNWQEIKKMKLLSGTALFLLVAVPWYYLMYLKHGQDFLTTFFGVHNFLRATVSEHPKDNVIYYYLMIFLLSIFPWTFVLPAALKKYRKNLSRKAVSDKTAYLIIWFGTVNIFFQLVATKYCTYTFPALLPAALLLGNYLSDKRKVFCCCLALALVLNTALIIGAAVPLTKDYSAREAARQLKNYYQPEMTVASLGEYSASMVFYSGLRIYRLESQEEIDKLKPKGISWNSKNVMPFISWDDVSGKNKVLLVVEKERLPVFRQNKGNDWNFLGFIADKYYLYLK